jgi:hypothetical protein
MKEGTATEGGCGPKKLLLNGWGEGMEEGRASGGEENAAFLAVEEKSQGRAVKAQEFEDKAHVEKGRNGMSIVNESHGVRGLVRNIASTGTFGKFGIKRSKEAVK